jgi:hypothetical protein
MENQKRLTDAEILLNVINAVKLTKMGSLQMQVQVSNEYLQYTRRSNGISDIRKNYPRFLEVSYNFIQTGRRCFKIGSQPYIAKKEHYPMGGPENQNQI